MASPFSRKRLRQLLHELNLRWMPPADIIWSKGVGDFCDVAGPWKYRRGQTESTQSDAFFARHYGAAAGLVWVRLGTIAREGQACDLDRFAKVALPHITRPFILITTDGDLSVPSELSPLTVAAIKSHPRLIAWYSQNADGSDTAVIPFPIGLDLHTARDKAKASRLLPMLLELGKSAPSATLRPLRVFSDLNLQPTAARAEAHEAVKGCEHVDFASVRVPQFEIWRRYASYPFLMSAHGNGLDCHRTWEALCLGCIVIVKTSSLDPLYEGLPVVIVEDWGQVRDIQQLKRWLEALAPLTAPSYIQGRLDPQAWLRPIRERLVAPEASPRGFTTPSARSASV
jgi:hypothetical protein